VYVEKADIEPGPRRLGAVKIADRPTAWCRWERIDGFQSTTFAARIHPRRKGRKSRHGALVLSTPRGAEKERAERRAPKELNWGHVVRAGAAEGPFNRQNHPLGFRHSLILQRQLGTGGPLVASDALDQG